VGQKGQDHWMNVVTACKSCNHRKGNRTPEQARMPLLYAPYVPSLWEDFILRNRRILADQMEFLMSHLPKSSRLTPPDSPAPPSESPPSARRWLSGEAEPAVS
jgi:hypothetical protein